MQYLDDDIVTLRHDSGMTEQFFWGDTVEVLARNARDLRVRIHGRKKVAAEGRIASSAKLRATPLLWLSMIDVQQGDGLILETPEGRIVFIDGGDNQLFARHAAFRYRGTTAADPLVVDLMLVTHGDADHFKGLVELRKSESDTRPNKSIFVVPQRYYHNGIVKRPDKAADGKRRKDIDLLGATTEENGKLYLTGLVEDPADTPANERNGPFQAWIDTLAAWEARAQTKLGAPIERRRIDHKTAGAFDFLAAEGVEVELLGPIVADTAQGAGLEFLHDAPDDAKLMLGTVEEPSGSYSASHTINGHSISFRLRYGNVRFLMTGDLNQAAGRRLREALPGASLRCEILKAPHHGSADFDMEFLKEAGPVVSLVSSGDESELKEYIHPRATFLAALGKASRTTPAVVLITELAAFFKVIGYVPRPASKPGKPDPFFAFERTNFGIIHVRTDGERVLVFTHSGKAGMNEAYRFTVSATGEVAFASEVVKRSAPAKS